RGRPRAGRRVVGRLPPRAARAPHRRARRLLRGLHRAATPADGTGRGLRLPGRVLGVLRPRSRHAERRPSRRAVRDLRAESRSGRQPRPGRPAEHDRAVRGGEAGGRPAAGGAGDPAALHGRGVRRDGAVPVLHVVPRSRPRRGGEEGARRGVQPLRVAGRGARSRRARDVRALASQSPAGRRAAPPRALPVLPALAGPASLASRAGRAGQGARAGDGGREGDDAHALPRGRVWRRAAAARQPHERGSAGTVGAGRLAPAARLRRSALRGPGPPGAGALPDLDADPIDHLLALNPGGRGIGRFFQPGGARRAADTLRRARRVLVTTGFVVDSGAAETDGPPGAAVLGRALRARGAEVRYVTDAVTAPVLSAALTVLDEAADVIAWPDGDDAARRLLASERPTHLVAIERPGRARDGTYRNMRGADVSEWNAGIDELFVRAG